MIVIVDRKVLFLHFIFQSHLRSRFCHIDHLIYEEIIPEDEVEQTVNVTDENMLELQGRSRWPDRFWATAKNFRCVVTCFKYPTSGVI